MTRRKRNEPIEYEGETYASIRELADKCFEGRYNEAYQTVLRYEKRRNRAVVWYNLRGERMEFKSLADLGRYLGVSRERARQLINERDNEQAQS